MYVISGVYVIGVKYLCIIQKAYHAISIEFCLSTDCLLTNSSIHVSYVYVCHLIYMCIFSLN